MTAPTSRLRFHRTVAATLIRAGRATWWSAGNFNPADHGRAPGLAEGLRLATGWLSALIPAGSLMSGARRA